jgi:hypothetical protein
MASSISAGTTSSTALVATADTSGALELKTNNGTTALTLSTAQVATFAGTAILPTTLGVGGATPSTSGSGITFPATASASSNANTLDDYEEGTWTPADGSGAGLSITVTDASYVKIGRLVFINAYFTYPVTANTTSAQLSGLPFTSQSGNNYSFIMGRTQTNLGNMVAWQVNNGNTTLAANLGWNSTTSPTNANLSNSYFLISGCYQSA